MATSLIGSSSPALSSSPLFAEGPQAASAPPVALLATVAREFATVVDEPLNLLRAALRGRGVLKGSMSQLVRDLASAIHFGCGTPLLGGHDTIKKALHEALRGMELGHVHTKTHMPDFAHLREVFGDVGAHAALMPHPAPLIAHSALLHQGISELSAFVAQTQCPRGSKEANRQVEALPARLEQSVLPTLKFCRDQVGDSVALSALVEQRIQEALAIHAKKPEDLNPHDLNDARLIARSVALTLWHAMPVTMPNPAWSWDRK